MREKHYELLRLLLPPLLLVAVSFAIYGSLLDHEFLTGWDDPTYVTKNEAVRGFSWDNIRTAFTTYYAGNYAPIQILSYMLDYTLFGMNASGFLFTNILLHAGNGVLLYLLLTRLHSRHLWAFFAALIFLVHPLQVESVAWISQRKNVLAMLFFLPAIYWYVLHRDQRGRKGTAWYLLSIAAFILALLAKSVAVILPPILLLYNLCFRRDRSRSVWIDLIPYIAAAGVVALLSMQSQNPEFDGGKAYHYPGGSLYTTALTMLPVLARYLGMIFWPTELSAWYAPPVRTGIDAEVALSFLLLTALAAVGLALWLHRRTIFFWYAIFFIGLIPVSQIVPLMTLMNDRYLYFPLLGAAPFLCALLMPPPSAPAQTKVNRQTIAGAVFAILILFWGALTVERNGVWKNSVTLWRDAAGKAPGHYLPHHGLGCALLKDDQVDEAITALTRALELNPRNVETYNELGICYGRKEQYDRAIELFDTVLRIDPTSAPARANIEVAKELKRRAQEQR
ncbi:tetratricopeptide repeat protein [Geobacter sp. DSM 9736]|uniref:tetratricopeptide repeat protein n=1 Tax=Geobacter sp. DSM 9736 TaxID=1277350 RepID=UPI000B503E09|nr:tetratricopeptide repeat protein [Geobacter sp. DSM 9736]SNB45326.1 4-amino-4-deoxy-L-arabinose transferase [Geobacter sp. DSM 9736]